VVSSLRCVAVSHYDSRYFHFFYDSLSVLPPENCPPLPLVDVRRRFVFISFDHCVKTLTAIRSGALWDCFRTNNVACVKKRMNAGQKGASFILFIESFLKFFHLLFRIVILSIEFGWTNRVLMCTSWLQTIPRITMYTCMFTFSSRIKLVQSQ
jgi:hypothetical protein